MDQWFIQSKGQVEGPYSREVIEKRIKSGHLQATDLVWGRAMEHWRTLHWWQNSAHELAEQETRIAHPEAWHYAFDGKNNGPFSWIALLIELRRISTASIDHLSQIMLWTKGMKNWTSVLEFHDVMEELGVNKREHARANINGKVTIRAQGLLFTTSLKTISEGGFGTDPVAGLSSGQIVNIELESNEFRHTLNAKAEVRYSTSKTVGFKFTEITTDNVGLIAEFVKKAGRNIFLQSA